MRELTDEELQRFWHYVDRRGDNECWPWLRKGAGTAPMFCIDNTAVSALRIMYQLYYGEEVPDDKALLRTCGARGFDCCNPRHLIIVKRGTRYSTWWKQQLRAARGSVDALAELAGFNLVETESGYYRVIRPESTDTVELPRYQPFTTNLQIGKGSSGIPDEP